MQIDIITIDNLLFLFMMKANLGRIYMYIYCCSQKTKTLGSWEGHRSSCRLYIRHSCN